MYCLEITEKKKFFIIEVFYWGQTHETGGLSLGKRRQQKFSHIIKFSQDSGDTLMSWCSSEHILNPMDSLYSRIFAG